MLYEILLEAFHAEYKFSGEIVEVGTIVNTEHHQRKLDFWLFQKLIFFLVLEVS